MTEDSYGRSRTDPLFGSGLPPKPPSWAESPGRRYVGWAALASAIILCLPWTALLIGVGAVPILVLLTIGLSIAAGIGGGTPRGFGIGAGFISLISPFTSMFGIAAMISP